LLIQNKTDQNHLLLISLKAGGRGLNLTSPDTVIHYDRWWTRRRKTRPATAAGETGGFDERDIDFLFGSEQEREAA
jgi:hypothetical protein